MTTQGIVGEFLGLKEETDADLLTMQCGDFYEFFGDDAELVGDELDLKVSQKSAHGSSYPMAGVPVDDLTPYLTALVERGYRVAVADQYETEDGHAREITRVVTPGTLLETADDAAQYLASVVRTDDGFGLAFADVTTGRFLVTETEDVADVYAELYRFAPAELLPGPDLRGDDDFLAAVRDRTEASLTLHGVDGFAPGRAEHALREQFGRETLDSVGLGSTAAVRAAGGVLSYVEETGVGVAKSMTRLQTYAPTDHLELDATTQRNLELTETMHGDRQGSLLDTVDHTVTSAGRRRLREWLTRPRRSPDEIRRRHDCVDALASAALARERVRETLDGTYDLERLASRAAGGRADASDLLAVRETLSVLPELAAAVDESSLADSPLSDLVARPDHDAAGRLRGELDHLADDPPKTITSGGLFERGYDDELDDLLDSYDEVRSWLDGLADREKARTGITHLQVDRNKTDGYYIQVGKSEADRVPDDYREIKTLKNSRRYVTEELEAKEREILRLEEARGDLEYDRFRALRESVAERAALLQDVGRAVAEVDALASLATHAAGNDWTRPELTDAGPLRIEAGRHPVVEQTTDFVPNDLTLDEDRRFLIVTGPNMSGKSTYMRQAALVTLLAQAGSFVPARSATVGLVDGIYTRVGALDELAQGRSTFMVEMQELSNILHSATDESLVILDEVGRGTATYDGISIAWAATEYLSAAQSASPSPKVLFATHYHELTTLANHVDSVANVHVAVDGEPESPSASGRESRPAADGDVTFLRTVRDGPADRSYGIHVADLAGVPEPVVDRARDVLRKLRDDEAIDVRGGGSPADTQQVVFDVSSGELRAASDGHGREGHGDSADRDGEHDSDGDGEHDSDGDGEHDSDGDGTTPLDPEVRAILDDLDDVDVEATSPLELMSKVQEWQSRLDGE